MNTRTDPPPEEDFSEDDDGPVTEVDMGHIVLRPDGYHWQTPDGSQEFGPYDSLEDAFAAMQAADGETPEPGETLQEAEDEVGISDWIDPDTGELAEGQSTPRLHDE
jgi:hypothetical protein